MSLRHTDFVPAAPAILRITVGEIDAVDRAALGEPAVVEAAKTARLDVAAVVKSVAREIFRPEPAPKLDAMELELLRQAERCANGESDMPPRRELVAAALREVERERWWRDYAEAEVAILRERVAELEARDAWAQREFKRWSDEQASAGVRAHG